MDEVEMDAVENPLWIEWADGSARWGNVSDEDQDKILAFAEALLGAADTLA